MKRPREWSTDDMLGRAAMIFDAQAALATGSARAAHKETAAALRERAARIRGLEGMPDGAIVDMGVAELWRRLNGALAAPPAGAREQPQATRYDGWAQTLPWPDPTPEMLAGDAVFEAIWRVIKGWDINVPGAYSGYMGATGNHVRAILDAIHEPLAAPPAGVGSEACRTCKGQHAQFCSACMGSGRAPAGTGGRR